MSQVQPQDRIVGTQALIESLLGIAIGTAFLGSIGARSPRRKRTKHKSTRLVLRAVLFTGTAILSAIIYVAMAPQLTRAQSALLLITLLLSILPNVSVLMNSLFEIARERWSDSNPEQSELQEASQRLIEAIRMAQAVELGERFREALLLAYPTRKGIEAAKGDSKTDGADETPPLIGPHA